MAYELGDLEFLVGVRIFIATRNFKRHFMSTAQ